MAGGWSSLPGDLLNLVSARLSSDADHLHIHQVCTHWRASTSSPAAYRPWVVAGREPSREDTPIGDFSLWPPRGVRRVAVAPPPGLPCCCGTPRGWVALVDDVLSPTRFLLWDPISGAEIPLPCMDPVIQVFLSGDPLASPDWMAAATQLKDKTWNSFFFWRPGDAAWTGPGRGERGIHSIQTVAFHAGKMYCLDDVRNIAIYDLNLGTPATSPPVLIHVSVATPTVLLAPCIRRCGGKIHGQRGVHLVEFKGDLLLVLLFHARHPTFAELYRLQWTPELCFELGERVTDLGGFALFVGRGDAFALSSQEFPAIKGNCVYYAMHIQDPFKKQWAFVFDLELEVLEEIPNPQVHDDDGSNCWPHSWYCPARPLLKQ